MSTVKIDSNNDIVFENGDLALVTGREEIAQILRHELRTFIGEWFLDTSIGIDYFGEVFTKRMDVANVDAMFKSKILSSPGVIELLEFTLDLDALNRKLTLSFSVSTNEGIIDFRETF